MEQQLAHCLSACISTRDHPRSSITIVVQEMSDDGALLACAVNAACVALMEAGVPLRCCVAAVHVAVPVEGGLAIDPTTAETTVCAGRFGPRLPRCGQRAPFACPQTPAAPFTPHSPRFPARPTQAATGSLTFGVTNATADGATEAEAADVVLSATRGAFTPDQCQSSLVVARAAAKSVFAFYRKSLERRLSKDAYIARQMNA